MTLVQIARRSALMASFSLLVGCSQGPSVEGTYVISKGPMTGPTVTLGKNTFVFSTGANGKYEVADGKVMFSSFNFAEVMKIDGENLVNDKWQFLRKK